MLLSTDPTKKDTDGDTIPDGEEVRRWGSDPTLYDIRAPEIRISQAKWEVDGLGTEFMVRWGAGDPSGVSEVVFTKEGDELASVSAGGSTSTGGRTYFEVGFFETTADAVTGSTVNVKATDVHENTKTDVALQRRNFYGNLAGELDQENIYTVTAASEVGKLSGFSTAVGSVPREAKQSVEALPEVYESLRENPLGFIDGIQRFITVLQESGVMDTLVALLAKPVQRKQQLNNPYDKQEESKLYNTFAARWYQGYVAGKLATTVLSAGIGKAVKSSTAARKFGEIVGKTRVGRLAKLVNSKKAAVNRKIARTLVRGAATGGLKVVRGAKTAGSVVRTSRLVDRAGIDTADLSAGEARGLRLYLQRGGEGAADEIGELDKDQVEVAFSFVRSCTNGHATSFAAIRGKECTLDIDKYKQNQIIFSISKKEVNPYKFQREIKSAKNTEEINDIINKYDDGPRAIVNAYKWSTEGEVRSPSKFARQMKILDKRGVEVNNLDGIGTDNLVTIQGHLQEIDIALILRSELDGDRVAIIGNKYGTVKLDSDISTNDIQNIYQVEIDLVIRDKKTGEVTKVIESKDRSWDFDAQFRIDRAERRFEKEVRAMAQEHGKDVEFVYWTSADSENIPRDLINKAKELREEGFNVKIRFMQEEDKVDE